MSQLFDCGRTFIIRIKRGNRTNLWENKRGEPFSEILKGFSSRFTDWVNYTSLAHLPMWPQGQNPWTVGEVTARCFYECSGRPLVTLRRDEEQFYQGICSVLNETLKPFEEWL